MLNPEEENFIDQLQAENQSLKTQNIRSQTEMAQSSIFNQGDNTNLIQWQLDLREELERIDHLLRGHIVKTDEKNNEYWHEPTDTNFKPFNDFGVQVLMNIISFYINRNTILSNYDENMINIKMYDFQNEITDLILLKYEEMGMDTSDKKSLYPIIVREITDSVHSTYLRALKGGERESLRTARHVTQNDSMGQPNKPSAYNQPKRFSLNPMRWLRS